MIRYAQQLPWPDALGRLCRLPFQVTLPWPDALGRLCRHPFQDHHHSYHMLQEGRFHLSGGG